MKDRQQIPASRFNPDQLVQLLNALDQHRPGVWFKTKRGKVKPHLLFVAQTAYRERFDFTGVGEKEVRRVFAVEFEKAWSKAIDTAR